MEITVRRFRGIAVAIAVALAAVGPSGAALTANGVQLEHPSHRPVIIRETRGGSTASYNWSGYAVTGARGSVTNVKGSWIVPAIQGTCGATSQYSSFWIGIDGFNSTTVEQIGTDSDCQNGTPTYYAWFELYPHPFNVINSLTVSPGDTMSAEVAYSGGQFTLSLTNVTTQQSFSVSVRMPNAKRSSAEWIAEAPSGAGGILPLADFGTALFGADNTAVANTSFATINGTTSAISGFGSAAIQQITMVSSGGATKARPSPLSNDGTSFTDQWVSAGP